MPSLSRGLIQLLQGCVSDNRQCRLFRMYEFRFRFLQYKLKPETSHETHFFSIDVATNYGWLKFNFHPTVVHR